MACAAQHPLFLNDLSHSQYLWPIPSTNLDELVADTHLRNEYKHQVESKLAYSDAFRKQFLLFAEQFLYELKRNQGQGLDGFDLSRLATPIGGGDCTDDCCATASVADQSPHLRSLPSSPSPRAVAPPTPTSKHHKFRLLDPPPRLSSPLTPNPCGTLLRGDEPRRPMPRRRHHATPLLKQVLEKMIEPEYRQRRRTRSKSKTRTGGIDEDQDRGVYQRLDPMFDGLGSGWVVVPEEEWEMVTEGCMTTSMIL